MRIMQPNLKPSKVKILRQAFFKLLAVAFSIIFSTAVYANSKIRANKPIQLHAAYILGYGVSVGYHVFPNMYLGLDSFSLSDEGAILDVELDYSFATNQIIGRYFPWNQYGFCLQLGFVSRDWLIKGSNNTYVGNDTVKRDTDVMIEWSRSAVSYGVGWFLASKKGLSGGFGVGFISGSTPDVTIEAVGASSADIELEEQETAETLMDYTVFPYTHLSIGWNF